MNKTENVSSHPYAFCCRQWPGLPEDALKMPGQVRLVGEPGRQREHDRPPAAPPLHRVRLARREEVKAAVHEAALLGVLKGDEHSFGRFGRPKLQPEMAGAARQVHAAFRCLVLAHDHAQIR